MSDDAVNMSMRKFLKQVGVTSQTAIETAIRDTGGLEAPVAVRVVLTIDGLDLVHTVEGEISPSEGT